MKTYTLKLKTTSTTNYNLYDGTTLVSDTDLGTLFGSAGEAYFTFDFNSLTPTNTTSLTILDSQDTAVITNTGLSGIAEDKNFKGTWSASATAFDSFTLLTGVAMDEAQLGKLAGMIKDGGVKTLTTADYNYPTDNPNSIALWLLKPGVYKLKGELRYRVTSSGSYYGYADKELVVIVSNFGSNTDKLILYPDTYRYNLLAVTSSGSTLTYSFSGGSSSVVLTGATVRNNLTSTDTTFPLSANQGKVLNERIGDLTTLTTTDKTSTVAAINELAARVALLEGGSN